MRTADRLAQGQWAFPLGVDETRGFMEWAAFCVREGGEERGPVIVADNVARYVHERNAAIALEGYPSLAPPWQHFWIEYPSSGVQRRGVLVLDTTALQDGPAEGETLAGDIADLSGGAKRHAIAGGAAAEDIRWVITLGLFIEQERQVWGPAGFLTPFPTRSRDTFAAPPKERQPR